MLAKNTTVKSMGIAQIYQLNQLTTCLVKNKKKPSAKNIFVKRGSQDKRETERERERDKLVY